MWRAKQHCEDLTNQSPGRPSPLSRSGAGSHWRRPVLWRVRRVESPRNPPKHVKSRSELPITYFAHNTTVVGDGRVPARGVLAARDMATEGRRAAGLDRAHHLELGVRKVALHSTTPSRAVVAEDIRDLQRWTRHVSRSTRPAPSLAWLSGSAASDGRAGSRWCAEYWWRRAYSARSCPTSHDPTTPG
jgi:hypothetical protein